MKFYFVVFLFNILCESFLLLPRFGRTYIVVGRCGKASAVSCSGHAELEEYSRKKEALDILDCLTSSNDPEDPSYDVQKDIRRDELLLANGYENLKHQLRAYDLPTSGDKLEMITRLLVHIIEPTISYDQRYLREFRHLCF